MGRVSNFGRLLILNQQPFDNYVSEKMSCCPKSDCCGDVLGFLPEFEPDKNWTLSTSDPTKCDHIKWVHLLIECFNESYLKTPILPKRK